MLATNNSAGIGLAVAQYLLEHGHRLVITSRSATTLDALKDGYHDRVQVIAGNMGDLSLAEEAVKLAMSKWQQLHGLVINHGMLDPITRIADADVDAWVAAYEVNFFSAVALIKAALPALRASKGRIIMTSSGAATTGYSTWGCYGSSKAAMNHLALTLASEEPEVTTIAIRPGTVDTEMQRDIREKHSSLMDEKDAKKFAELPTNGGLLKPWQPGNVIAKLALNAPNELIGRFLKYGCLNRS